MGVTYPGWPGSKAVLYNLSILGQPTARSMHTESRWLLEDETRNPLLLALLNCSKDREGVAPRRCEPCPSEFAKMDAQETHRRGSDDQTPACSRASEVSYACSIPRATSRPHACTTCATGSSPAASTRSYIRSPISNPYCIIANRIRPSPTVHTIANSSPPRLQGYTYTHTLPSLPSEPTK